MVLYLMLKYYICMISISPCLDKKYENIFIFWSDIYLRFVLILPIEQKVLLKLLARDWRISQVSNTINVILIYLPGLTRVRGIRFLLFEIVYILVYNSTIFKLMDFFVLSVNPRDIHLYINLACLSVCLFVCIQ